MRLSNLAQGIALALFFTLVLVASAPARLLGYVLPSGQIVMDGFQGTLWSGSASRCVLHLPPGPMHLGSVSWSLDPLSLLTFAPRLTVASEWGEQRIQGELRLRGARDLDLKDVQTRSSADLVRRFLPLAVDGVASVQLAQLSLRDGLPYSADGRIVWQDGVFLSTSGRVPLGSYAMEFKQAEGEVLRGEVITLSGSLLVAGQMQLDRRRYVIDLAINSDEPLDPQLKNALDLMAVPENGGYRIVLDSEF
jgi:hypothetical protein